MSLPTSVNKTSVAGFVSGDELLDDHGARVLVVIDIETDDGARKEVVLKSILFREVMAVVNGASETLGTEEAILNSFVDFVDPGLVIIGSGE